MASSNNCRVCRPDMDDNESDNGGDDGFDVEPKNKSKPHRELFEDIENQWSEKNIRVIKHISQALNRPQEVVSNFLYNLTFENFGRSLNPRSSCMCKVPLVDCCTCDLYLGIFDDEGNLRNPIRRDCLRKLIQVLREALQIKTPLHIERVDLFTAIGMKRPKKMKNLGKQCCYASCSPVTQRKRGLRNLYAREGTFNAYEQAHISQSGSSDYYTEMPEIAPGRGLCDQADDEIKDDESDVEEIDFEKIKKMRASRFKSKFFDKEPIQMDPYIEEDIVLQYSKDDEDILPYPHISPQGRLKELPLFGDPEMVVLLPLSKNNAIRS